MKRWPLVLTVLVAFSTLFNGGLSHSAEPNKEQEAAIAYFKKLGGKVTVDEKSSGKPVIGLSLRFSPAARSVTSISCK